MKKIALFLVIIFVAAIVMSCSGKKSCPAYPSSSKRSSIELKLL